MHRKNSFIQFIKKIFKSFAFGFFGIFVAIVLGLVATVLIFYFVITPSASEALNKDFPASSKIYSRDGQLLYEVYGEYKRDPVTLEEIPKQLQQASIAIEDKDFYKHGAISFKDILRAAWTNYKNQDQLQGASTLTQQYVKNAFYNNQKSYYRKLVEAIVAQKIESKASKDKILELYLNSAPYGRNAYGVATAAKEYYGKELKELSLAENAYLAALPQAPSFYDPLGKNRDALDKRKDEVLKDMKEQGYINDDEYTNAKSEEVKFIERSKQTIVAPYFVFWVQQQLSRKYGEDALQTKGYKIYTSLDLRLQDIAEKTVWDGVKVNAKKYNAHNAALVAIDPRSGEVLAMVGGKDYFAPAEPSDCKAGKNCLFEPNVNVADSARQPGSSFKVYTYLTAFGKDFKFSPASMLVDSPVTYGGTYSPKNYNGGYSGRVSIRKALAGSLNVPPVKLLNEIGIDNVVNTAHTLGITAPLQHCGLSLTLGSCEVKLVDHVLAYSTIASGGVYQGMCSVVKMIDLKGNEVQTCPKENKQVVDSQAVYELESIMTDNDSRAYVFGKNSPLAFKDRPVAAKTGTTDLWKDGWTVGFTPSLAVGVWAGNNNGTLMKAGADGVFVAAPIWRAFLDKALEGAPVEQFWKPDSIKQLTIKDVPPSLRGKYQFTKKNDIFADYSVPKVEPPKPKPVAVAPPKAPEPPKEPEKPKENTQPVIANPDPVITVSIRQPSDFSNISRYPYAVKANASDPSKVAHMEVYLDGQFLQTVSGGGSFNFSISKIPEPGVHTLMVIATDLSGRTSTDSVSVTFVNEDLRP